MVIPRIELELFLMHMKRKWSFGNVGWLITKSLENPLDVECS